MIGDKLHCLRCDHIWNSRVTGRPRQCPKCHQSRWDRPSSAKPSANCVSYRRAQAITLKTGEYTVGRIDLPEKK